MMMYTSGWPKIQNKCCHKMGSAPAAGTKNNVPNVLSRITSTSAMVSGGNAKMIMNDVTSIIHTNTGMRMNVMPGARMLTMVTMRFMAVAVVPTPDMNRPNM